MRRMVLLVWLTALWLVLWGEVSVANVLSGVLVAALVTQSLSLEWAGASERLRVRPLAVASFLGYFAWKLLEANVVLAREIVTPRNHIQTGIIAVPMIGVSAHVVTVVANAVSLTPGTVTLEVGQGEDHTLYVHVLHLHDIEQARADIRTLTRLATRALEWGGGRPTEPEVPAP